MMSILLIAQMFDYYCVMEHHLLQIAQAIQGIGLNIRVL